MEKIYKQLALDNGIVGAGGAGFPTHVKLNATVDYLVVNGAECEPLMTVDQVLMHHFSDHLTATIDALREELGAKEAIIGIKAKHVEVVDVMKKTSGAYTNVRVEPLGDFYPAGDEVVLVYETTGRQIPQGGIPLDCKVVVINIETLYNLWQASQGSPLVSKWVTVAGHVPNPGTYYVPLGVTIGQMIELAGGASISDYSVINGGPMMGKLVNSLDEPVTKTTKGLLVLPNDNPVIENHHRLLTHIIKQAQSICCQCRLCTDLCPRNLLGYGIEPNKTILSAGYSFSVNGGEAGKGALLCSECGACDMYACPMGLSPRRVNQVLKSGLAQQKIAPPDKGKEVKASEWRPYRRIPTKRLVARLGLNRYNSPDIWMDQTIDPELVTLPLRQHIGAPSVPVVKTGDSVNRGDLIADIPEKSLGSKVFASISGTVREVTSDYIRISKA